MAQIVRIGKKKFAVGLSWGPLSSDGPLRPQAEAVTRHSKNDLYVLSGDVEPQVGHCDRANSVKPGLPVLAPLVADGWPANTLLAVGVDGGRMIGFQILNGNIFDDVVGSEGEIRTWFESLVGEHKWDHVSSPWGSDAARSGAFEETVRATGLAPPKLRAVGGGRRTAVKASVLILAALVALVVAEKIARNRREMALRLEALSRHVVRQVTPPARIVPVGPFVAGCLSVLERLPSDSVGWSVSRVACHPRKIRILWRRDEGSGTVRDLEKSLGSRVELSGKNAAMETLPLSVPAFDTPVDRLRNLSEEKKDLASVLEYYGLDFRTEGGSFLPGLDGAGGSGFSVPLPGVPEGGLLSALGRVDGLSVRELEWNGRSQWTLKGELKHAPIILVNGRSGDRSPGPPGSPPGGKSGPPPSAGTPRGNGGRERQFGPIPGNRGTGAGSPPGAGRPGGKSDGKAGGASLPPLRLP